jgi:hypothetical protein
MNADGSQQVVVRDNGGNPLVGSSFNWSPDGQQIVYYSELGTEPRVYVKDGSGTVKTIASNVSSYTQTAWQPIANNLVYRLANWKTHERLFTTSPEEVFNAVKNYEGWVYEGIAFRTYGSSGAGHIPVYRMANWKTHERLFTTSLEEAQYAVAHYEGWVLEGIAFYANSAPTGTPVYRLSNWHSNERLFTASWEEASTVPHTYYGWVLDGIAFYIP